MKRSSLAVHVVLLMICIVALSGLVQAQYRTSIQGVVTDPTGAVIPDATLTLTNPATGEKLVRTSNQDGVYNFNALNAAGVVFTLEVEKTGFQKKVIDHLQFIPEQANALNVQLEIGAQTQTVTVDASKEPLLDTETASVNGVVSSNQIQHLPSFGRDVTKLTQLAPGLFADGSQAGGGGSYNLPGTQSGPTPSGGSTGIFSTENLVQGYSNGNQAQNTGIAIDGISTTSAVWGGSTVVTPSEDSVEDVKIITNSYDAEDSRFTGAQVQITSKSGTNDIHGSLFFTTHQPNLNAYQPYFGVGTSSQRDNHKFNQFGGSVGGPIWKNKIFAFFNYETVRQPNSDLIGTGWYDTTAFDGLAPTNSIAATYLSFPGNGIVSHGLVANTTCGSVGLTEGVNCATVTGGLNLGTPLTTGLGTQDLGWTDPFHPGCGGAGTGCGTPGSPLGTTPDIADYITSNPTTFTAVQYNGRLDANVTSRDRIAFAIYWVPQSTDDYNGARTYDIFHHNQINDAFSIIWNHTFSPNFLNELRANAAGWRWNELKDNPQTPIGLPSDGFTDIGSAAVGNFGGNVGSELNPWTYSYKDVATKIIGRHTIKFGGDATRLFYLNACVPCGVPSYGFFNLWDFLNDAPQREGYTTFDPHSGLPTTARQDNRENILGFFAQDDLKVRPNLTLNLGLRWSYFGPLSSKQNNMYVANPGGGPNFLTGLTVTQGDSWNAQKNNFGPEIGFAWSPTKFNNRLVFRGGYGLNYNQEEIAISANVSGNPGLSIGEYITMATPTSPNPGIVYGISTDPHSIFGYSPNPNFIVSFGPNGLPITGSVGIDVFPHTVPTMRTHHYSFDMQYDLGHQYVMSLGYQGSLSRDIFFNESPLAVPATSGYALNPSINGGDYYNVNGRGNYNALLAEVKHQFSQQFMADAQYTFSRSMDTSSAPYSEQPYPYDLNLDYGRSDYNVTNAFKLFGMWQPTFFKGGNTWVDKIAGGWSLSGIFNWHSGFPWTPTVSTVGGSLYCGQCGYYSLFPAAYLGGAGSSTSNAAFEQTAAGPSANFPNGGGAYFSTPTYTPFPGTTSGTTLPQSPGVSRGYLTLPGYKDVDLTLAKGFGLPKMPVLGENARIELRMDAFNVFNNLNLNPTSISSNIGSSNFGTISSALAARVLSLGARFSF
ncbi:MAG: carboxypeptidase regulatory-like domain-containing protein [Terriglobales bacterium]